MRFKVGSPAASGFSPSLLRFVSYGPPKPDESFKEVGKYKHFQRIVVFCSKTTGTPVPAPALVRGAPRVMLRGEGRDFPGRWSVAATYRPGPTRCTSLSRRMPRQVS